MISNSKVAIVAALEREVRPLVRNWTATIREQEGSRIKIFENDQTALICGGIGPLAARRATEIVISAYHPDFIISAGFAGALEPRMQIADIFIPKLVIDAKDGSTIEIISGKGKLLTASGVAGVSQKSKFATAYGAQAVDMEAAAVGRSALSHGIRFVAIKSISDEHDFQFPSMEGFIDHHGNLSSVALAASLAVRPWLWARAAQLARHTAQASQSLCKCLNEYIRHPEKLDNLYPQSHPIQIAES